MDAVGSVEHPVGGSRRAAHGLMTNDGVDASVAGLPVGQWCAGGTQSLGTWALRPVILSYCYNHGFVDEGAPENI